MPFKKNKTHNKTIQDLKQLVEGDVQADNKSRRLYSHDASLFEVRPEAVVFPKNSQDVCRLVTYVAQHKHRLPELSLTGRSAGTDMSGGAVNDSIIVGFERYFTQMSEIVKDTVKVQPGVAYRDLEAFTLGHQLLMPSYPASKDLCMIGGIVNNNSGGEKSLRYGKTQEYVKELKMVLRDGQEHTIKPLNKNELNAKLREKNLEGDIYRKIHRLVEKNHALLKNNKPVVTKNSTGYNLWDVWDGRTFDLTKLIVGGQGTLGLLTEATFRLVPAAPLSGMLVAFLPNLNNLGQLIKALLPLKPTSLESFDEHTLKFAFRFFISFRKTLGWKRFILLGLSFIPLVRKLLRYLPNLPKLILLIEFEGQAQSEIDDSIARAREILTPFHVETHIAADKKHEEKFWLMRRESFNLLRKNVKRRHTAPFIDDLIVPVSTLSDFLPRLTEIMERHTLLYTVAGHMGDGNFHIIPLMNLADKAERQKIPVVLDEVTDLVLEYNGSLSGEHNDGLIRGPFLSRMYEPAMLDLFKEVKQIFDPENIFNPHKKTDADWDYSARHIRKRF